MLSDSTSIKKYAKHVSMLAIWMTFVCFFGRSGHFDLGSQPVSHLGTLGNSRQNYFLDFVLAISE